MYQRSEIDILKKRIKEPRKFVQVIMGPRQVGKTTLISQLVGKCPMHSVGMKKAMPGLAAIREVPVSWKEFLKMNPGELF